MRKIRRWKEPEAGGIHSRVFFKWYLENGFSKNIPAYPAHTHLLKIPTVFLAMTTQLNSLKLSQSLCMYCWLTPDLELNILKGCYLLPICNRLLEDESLSNCFACPPCFAQMLRAFALIYTITLCLFTCRWKCFVITRNTSGFYCFSSD